MPKDREPIRFKGRVEVVGINSHLVDDLQDIAVKFGTVNPAKQESQFRSGVLDEGLQLTLTIPTRANTSAFLLVARTEFIMGQIRTLETNKGTVVWDSGLTAADANKAVTLIDKKYQALGFVDPETGERLPIPAEEAARLKRGIRSVDEIFRNPQAYFITVIEGRSAEEILSEFDQPEKLEIRFDGKGHAIIGLK